MWQEAVGLRSDIAAGTRPAGTEAAPAFQRHREVGFALIGAAISTIAVLVASAFWILTAWPNGPLAVTFAGIMCALLGGRDDPATASAGFLKMSVVGAIIAGVYLFVLLPPLSTFTALVVALAPLYLVCGVLLTARTTTALVMPVIFVGGALIGLTNTMDYDFGAYANDVVGYVVGIGIGTLLLGLLRPIGTEWAVRRLTRAMMADLARIAGAAGPDQRAAFESRMFDRINELFARLDPAIDEERAAMQSRLASLRVGLNILVLQTLRPRLPSPAAAVVADVLAALAQAFGQAARHGQAEMPLGRLDAARGRLLALDEDAEVTRAAEALYSIDITLRQHPDLFGLSAPGPAAVATDAVTA
jgi:uncharacterized membrane protein YccC